MTVIAYRAGLMAADSMVLYEAGDKWTEFKLTNCIKIIRKHGWLLAVSGSMCPPDQMTKEWFFGSAKSSAEFAPRSVLPRFKFTMMAVSPRGKLCLWDQRGQGELLSAKFFAIGAGAELAMGAMEAGANAVKAVKIAIKHSPQCGGRVIVRRRK